MKNKIRYKLSPQMKIYDKLEVNWSPYLMFKQNKDIKSSCLNTDEYGLRFTDEEGNNQERYTLLSETQKIQEKQIAVVGGSFAFGVGASSDSKTISSILSKKSNYKVYNLGMRAHNSFQELINFQLMTSKFSNLKYIILASGFNDIFLSRYIDSKEKFHSPFFYQSEFANKMNYPSNSLIKKIMFEILPESKQRIINWSFDSKKNIIKKIFSKTPQIKDLKNDISNWQSHYKNNFKIWSMLAQGFNAKVIFAFQPYFNWCKNIGSDEEKEIIEEVKGNKFQKVYKVLNQISKQDYEKANNFFMEECSKNNFIFINLNKEFKTDKYEKKWLFVDFVHCNDSGYNLVSDIIYEKLNK